MNPDRERELLEQIRQLEELNSILQDKLDAIYQIVAPEDEYIEETGLVNIDLPQN